MRGERGFTLIEMLVVMALMIVLMAIALPTLMTTMRAGKLRGVANQAAVLMRLARLDAIKHSAQGIVYIVPSAPGQPGRIEAFSDRNSNGAQEADEPILGTFVLPNGVDFVAPGGLVGAASVLDLTADADGGPNEAVFQRDGSILATGAFRIGDVPGNFLEVRIEPRATARVEVRKCLACTDPADSDDWQASGDNASHLGKAGAAWESWK